MDTLHLIFLSSTFTDLRDKREEVAQAMRLHGYIPIGMEGFTPTGEAQMDIIRRAIDKCDYYVLIVGGRYGSLNKDGISYTEAEYNYAKEKGLPILAFIHNKPEKISVEDTDKDPEKLEAFRQKLEDEYYVGYWNADTNLPMIVISAIAQTMNIKPAIGWVRANKVASEENIRAENDLRKERDSLRDEVKKLKDASGQNTEIHDIAGLDEKIPAELTTYFIKNITWKELFRKIATTGDMLEYTVRENDIKTKLGFSNEQFQKIRNQFQLLSLFTVQNRGDPIDGYYKVWKLTLKGANLMRCNLATRTTKK